MHPILNLSDAVPERVAHGDTFAVGDAPIGARIGAKQLGCSLAIVPPGKRAYPVHCHHVNEELFVILQGEGTLRMGANEYPVRAGDVISAPAGGVETAHQLLNTSAHELRYLMLSTTHPMEVVEYPDSGKVSVRVGNGPSATFAHRGKLGEKLEYWDGE